MVKVEFSPSGFKDLESQLYKLDDTALLLEANTVLNDYIDWVDNHIILTTAQLTYLEVLDALFINLLAVNAAIAFRNRLPLNLVLPNNYMAASQQERGKWILDKSTIVTSNSPGDPVTATGELVYEFTFDQ